MKRYLASILAAFIVAIFSAPASAQQVGAGCTPIGRGAVNGFFSDCAVATGTANAIILTPTFGVSPAGPLPLYTRYTFQAPSTNTAATTIRLGAAGPGPYSAYTNAGVALAGGEIVAGRWYTIGFDPALNSAAGGWRLVAGELGASSLLSSNNTWTGLNTFSPLTATSPAVTINPLAGSLGAGLVVLQSPAGSYSSGASGDLTFFSGVITNNFNVRDTTAGSFATFGGFGSQVIVNGPNAYSPNGTFGLIGDIQTYTIAPSSVGVVNQFSAILGRGIVRVSIPSGVTGYGMNGLNGNVAIGPGVTGVAQLSGVESDVSAIGSGPRSKFGYTVYLGPLDLHQGSDNDAAFYFAVAPGSTPGWHNAWLLDARSGTLFDSGACLLCTAGTLTIAKVVDVTGWTITGNAWASPGVTISGAGDIGARDITGRNGVFQFDEDAAFPFTVKNLFASNGAIAEYVLQTNTAGSAAYWQLANQSGSTPDVIFETGFAVQRRLSRMNGVVMITETKGGGSQFGTPMGGDCGAGCINAEAIRINNSPVLTGNQTLTFGTHLTGTSYNGSSPVTIATDAVSTSTVSTIVARDGSGNFAAATITAALAGNASTATALQNARTIGGVSFNGTANITVASATGGLTVSGGDLALGANNLTMTGSLGATGARLTKGWFTDLQVTNAIAGSITGNAVTVTGLTLANSLIQAGNFATTITSTATSNATLPAGTHTLAAIDLQQTWTAGQVYSGSSASFSPLQFNDTNTGGQPWLMGPGTGTASPDEFNLFNNTTAVTVARFGKTGTLTVASTVTATGYVAGAAVGVDCAGVTAGTVTVAKGIVTHC